MTTRLVLVAGVSFLLGAAVGIVAIVGWIGCAIWRGGEAEQ
jgi:hypothetical protein